MAIKLSRDKVVTIPIWVIKQKVEDDYDEYLFFEGAGENEEKWPYKDSTIICLNVLEHIGIKFDPIAKTWSDDQD